MIDRALMLHLWWRRHARPIAVASWLCFAVVCADYARFIDLPVLVTVPFWAGVIANVLRWGLWEAVLKARVQRTLSARREKVPGAGD